MYFQNCKNSNEAKSFYRVLAMKHHPDRGGDVRIMQAINREYHDRLKKYDGQTFHGSDHKEHTYRYNYKVEQGIMDKITELFKLRMQAVTIELIGTWLWVHGETRSYQTELKNIGLKWHSKRLKWFFHTKTTFRRRYKGTDFDTLRAIYGAATFEPGQGAPVKRDEPELIS